MRWMMGFACACALSAGIGAVEAQAQAVVSTGQSFVEARLLPGARQTDGTRLAGLRLTLAEGWKTYWRAPGEVGVPPSFDWSASTNVASVEVLWPRPHVFDSFGAQAIGYKGDVVLPVLITPVDPALPVRLALTADLGVCNEICVLEQFSVAETIGADEHPIGLKQIERARATVPVAGPEAGLDAATCRISGTGRERHLTMRLAFRTAPTEPVVVIEGTPDMWISGITAHPAPGGAVEVEATISLARDDVWIMRQDLRTTVLAGNLAADIRGCTAPAG